MHLIEMENYNLTLIEIGYFKYIKRCINLDKHSNTVVKHLKPYQTEEFDMFEVLTNNKPIFEWCGGRHLRPMELKTP